jgi:hypothetical protein
MAGNGFTITVMESRLLSHPVTVWLTYQVVLPTVVVGGTGAIPEPTPPVEDVYQSRLVPVAVNAAAVAFRQ